MRSNALDITFAALAHPARRAILERLATGEASVTELARPFKMTLPVVSKHLKVLEKAGLISRGRNAQWRPCRIHATPLRDVSDWVGRYRRLWDAQLDSARSHLQDLGAHEKEDDRREPE